jgi:predicted O-linked N-acetylglucosamine transferase (SPINDLY family)
MRAAPVQVSYCGYPNTTGVSAIDYRLTDAICDPPGEPRRHSEELLRLPGGFSCFAPPMNSPPVAAEPPVIARGTITFGSMHGLAKLNDGVLDLWAELLRAQPTARLLVCRHELAGRVKQRLLDRFAARGIGGDRLEIRGNLRGGQWLPVYDEIDILLDVFPWSGHTTACESLWMGVPVVTLAGRTHAGRMVASVLTSSGLPQWIGTSPQAYIRIAGQMAGDIEGLRELRRTLRQRFAASRAMDGRAFANELEEAYRLMWRRWCAKDGGGSI